MKTLLFSSLAFALMLMCSSFLQQNQKAKTAAPLPVSPFSRSWSGGEKCAGVSAPTAILSIRQRSGQQAIVNGIYSTQADVKADIKGNTLVIPTQELTDPQFVNFFIEGKLVLAGNQKSLKGNFIVRNNSLPDTCEGVYFWKK